MRPAGVPDGFRKIDQGKTKIVFQSPEQPQTVIIHSKDTITAGDGEIEDIISGKGKIVNGTTCNIFEFLERFQIPTHYLKKFNNTSFLARHCKMIPVEVVTRRKALGSYCERHPLTPKGTIFENPVVEFNLKDDPRHDPLIVPISGTGRCELFDAHKPLSGSESIGTIQNPFSSSETDWIIETSTKTFLVLEAILKEFGVELEDLKIEFGRPKGKHPKSKNNLVLADVIDPDSWRAKGPDGRQLSKQIYRETRDLEEMARVYREVFATTRGFKKIKNLKI